MTREEAIKRLEVVRTNALIQKSNGVSKYWQEEIDGTIEAIDMAIEALSAEEAVWNEYEAEFTDLPDIPRYYYEKVVGKMAHEINMLKEQLESADAEQGEWIDENGNNVPLHKDGYPLRSCYCNQCHEWLVASDEYEVKGNFCPNCGARMTPHKGGDDE